MADVYTRIETMIEAIKESTTAREEFNFVPGYIMDARDEGFKAGVAQGGEQGISRGLRQGIDQTVANMRRKNFGNSIIVEVTGLSLEAVKKL